MERGLADDVSEWIMQRKITRRVGRTVGIVSGSEISEILIITFGGMMIEAKGRGGNK